MAERTIQELMALAELARDQCEALAAALAQGDVTSAVPHLNSALNNLTALRVDLEELRRTNG